MPWPEGVQPTQVDNILQHSKRPEIYVTTFDYSFAVTGGTQAAFTISTHWVPKSAKVIGGWYQVSTTFTSGGSATVALSLVGANDLVTAIAVDDASAPWTIDLTKRKPLKLISTVLAAEKQVVLTVAAADLTAGILFGAVEWMSPTFVSSGH